MRLLAVLATLISIACATPGTQREPETELSAPGSRYEWRLPLGFPVPVVPADNPMSEAKVELGRRLFYDPRLSGNQTYSCSSCHRQELAFTDARARALGSTGELHPRGSMSLGNVAYARTLNWADPEVDLLEEQARVPMFNREPIELGLAGREREVEERLRAEPLYRELFARAFSPSGESVTLDNVRRAIASFERTLISGDSPYDRLVFGGERTALSEDAWAGMRLFHSERLGCFECHSGSTFSGPVVHVGAPRSEPVFHNTGLYAIGANRSYPPGNRGLFEHTRRRKHMGRFKAPTLRNIVLTAPYMHDGSIATLEAVLDLYAAGGRRIPSGPQAGDGASSPYKSPLVDGFDLTRAERHQLLAFLQSLTDETFITNPDFADPWQE